jgi:hypothetical protein
MITVSTTDEGEADDMAALMSRFLSRSRDYRVYLLGTEYAARVAAGERAAAGKHGPEGWTRIGSGEQQP